MITDRIKTIMDAHGLSASAFADIIKIQRSGISHIFSGRNKPSLDLILKIIEAFPDVTPEWLLLGKGVYIHEGLPGGVLENVQEKITKENHGDDESKQSEKRKTWDKRGMKLDQQDMRDESRIEEQEIGHVLLLFRNGTFRDYKRT